MSEGTTTEVQEEAASKRKVLSLGERMKVIDFLRSQPEPVVGDSNTAIATQVSAGSGVEIGWQQLKYMIDDPSLEEWKLGAKVHVRTLLSPEDERMAALEAKLEELSQSVAKLADRVLHIEANVQPYGSGASAH